MTNIMESCGGKILSLLGDGVIRQGAYVIQYKNQVLLLEEENKRLGEKRERIQGMVDRATNNGEVIETEVSSWLEKVEQMEGGITNFLDQPEDGESFRCFPGCVCPNLMWRYKRGTEAEKWKLDVSELISRGELLQTSPVTRYASFQSELLFDSSQYYTSFQSRALVVDEIKNALKDSGVDMIGVHGPGGAGKTTMAKEVAKEAKELGIFDKIVIAVVSKDPNTSKLQEALALQLDLRCEQTNELVRADRLRNALSNGKRNILVILDDLWQVIDLTAIGIPISGLGDRGCKILLTSRNEEVFKRMEVHLCFPIGYLEEREAWKLFTKVTGDSGFNESIARNVSKRCGGLPIAIVAVGAALKGKEEAEWQDALHQLENCPLKYIEGSEPVGYTPLKWSYDFLKDKDAKSCFLLCCLFPEDAEISIDDLVRYSFALGFLRRVDTLKVARNRVRTMVNILKRSCLLLNGENKNFVKMHDVFRDLAISITEEKQREPESGHDWPGRQQFIVDHNFQEWPKNDAWKYHTAISLKINHDDIHFPSGVLHCPLMHTLVLKSTTFYPVKSRTFYSTKIPNAFFQGMKETRVLDLENISMDLPSSVLELDHLRMLHLNNCKLLGDLSTIQNLNNHIEILSFKGSTIEELPPEIGKLTHLQSLDLRECRSLKVIPKGVISNLIRLEELYVTEIFKKWDTTIDGGRMSNASIAELKSLTQLTVLHVGISTGSCKIMVQECPNLFEKLINFAIFINRSSFRGFPNVLEIYSIHDIDDEFYLLMSRVENLRLSRIQDLRYLRGKPQPQLTRTGGGSFCKLTDLEIYECDSMKYLFSLSCAKALQQLKSLKVFDCSNIEQIIGVRDHYNEEKVVPDEAIIFSQLKKIYFSGLPQFRSFCPKVEKPTLEGPSNWATTAESIFNEKVSFPVLELLKINELPAQNIWNKQMIQSLEGSNKGSFSQLKNVEVIQCCNLVNVFPSNMLLRLQNLETLYIWDCASLTSLVEDVNPNIQGPTVKFKFIDVFPKLRNLELHNLHKLMKIWFNDGDYYLNDNSVHLYLKTISIRHCDSLRHAFSAFVARHLACIEKLHVQACNGMEAIVSEAREGVTDDVGIKFCQLKTLELVDLVNLKSFSQSKFKASRLFNYQVTFPKIECIWLENLMSSKEIQLWNLLSTTQEHLHTVRIIGCQVSTNVSFHHQKRSSKMIENLHIWKCQGFKHVIDFNGTINIEQQFVNLKKSELNDLPELVLLWNKNLHEILSLRSLKYIIIAYCSQLRGLFTLSMATTLQHLEELSVTACEMTEEIIIIEENNINFAGGEEAIGHIEFPKLEVLTLYHLPNLKNFCKDERGSFSFSSLRKIEVRNCPKMKTFASGQLCLPPMMRRARVGGEIIEITDLNAFFETRNEDNTYVKITMNSGDDFDEGEDSLSGSLDDVLLDYVIDEEPAHYEA